MTLLNSGDFRKKLGVLGWLVLLPSACQLASDVDLLEISGSGAVVGVAFLDADGTGTFTAGDAPLSDAEVGLEVASTGEVTQTATTDSAGIFLFDEVPAGSYRIAATSGVLADSLEVLGGEDPVQVLVGDTSQVGVGVAYPFRTVEEVGSVSPGTRIFTAGITQNPRANFDPTGRVHLAGDSLYLRALNVERAAIGIGDSVRVLGRLVMENGRRALVDVTPFILVNQAAIPVPMEASVGVAALADGGRLDAGLVRIRNAEISDTLTNGDGDFSFWASAGGDSIEVVLRAFLSPNPSLVRPDTIVRVSEAVGLLSPVETAGDVRWQLLVRARDELLIETKVADVSVEAAFDTTAASLGDTVEVSVVLANGGPQAATGVAVVDSVPAQLTFLSSNATRGSYDVGSATWTVGQVDAATADTLTLRFEVTDGSAGVVQNRADFLGLLREVDSSGADDAATAFLTIG